MEKGATLSSHLLRLNPSALVEATQHAFLGAAATSSLKPTDLKAWLAQDRLYAISYVSFIGQLLAKTSIAAAPDRQSTISWRIADLFIDALTNIRTELKLFEDTAAGEGFAHELGVSASLQTRAYQDLFAGAAAPSKPLLVGLAVLWATEECYLRAWKHAQGQVDPGLRPEHMDVMQRAFIPNWTSPEFEAFVRRIESLLNEYASVIGVGDGERAECEAAYLQVLEAEKNFWPVGGRQGRWMRAEMV